MPGAPGRDPANHAAHGMHGCKFVLAARFLGQVIFPRLNPHSPWFQMLLLSQEYLALRQVPKELAEKIRFQCIYKWKNTVFDEQRLLKVHFIPLLPSPSYLCSHYKSPIFGVSHARVYLGTIDGPSLSFYDRSMIQEFNPKMKRLVVDIIVGEVPARIPLIAGFNNDDFKTVSGAASCIR